MLGDKGRGWSWTRVLLGLPARQLHLCGDPAAGALLEELAAECGDDLTLKRYRWAALQVGLLACLLIIAYQGTPLHRECV
jgi:hypothetical protein